MDDPAPAGSRDATAPPEYEAFISYRHVEPDRAWANWLHNAIETYRVPGAICDKLGRTSVRLGTVFRDEEELAASSDLSAEIDAALERSQYLIVVCSPRTPESRWVNREVERFREWGRDDRILALLIEGEPSESFPPALRPIRTTQAAPAHGAGDEVVEPLAADVRAHLHGSPRLRKRAARLRLLACVLGCRYDDLRQRDQERRARSVAWSGALASALLVVMTVLAVIAMYQRDAAIDARERTATRFEDLRDVSNTFIFDFHDAIEYLPGALPARQLVVSKGLAYLEVMAGEAEADPAIRRDLATSYFKIGNIQGLPTTPNIGDSPGALASYDTSRTIFEELIAEGVANTKDTRDLALVLVHTGDIRAELGEPGEAEKSYLRAVDLYETLASAPDADADAQLDLSSALQRLGNMQMDRMEYDSALKYYERCLGIDEAVAQAAPSNVEYQFQLSISYSKVGDVLRDAKRTEGATSMYDDSLRVARAVVEAQPDNVLYQRSLAIAYDRIGGMYLEAGAADEAQQAFEEAFGIRQRTMEQAPEDVQAIADVAMSHEKLGQLQAARERFDLAAERYRAALALFARLVEKDGDNVSHRRGLGIEHERLAGALIGGGQFDEASDVLASAVPIWERLIERDPGNPAYVRSLGIVRLLMGTNLDVAADADGLTTESRVELLRQAREQYTEGRAIFEIMKEDGMLPPSDTGVFDMFDTRIASVEEFLNELGEEP